MHKIFDWFRGEKIPCDDQNHHHQWSSKRWKSSEKLKKPSSSRHKHKNGGRNSGSEFDRHFDAVASASTSSPANLATLGTTNGQYNNRNGIIYTTKNDSIPDSSRNRNTCNTSSKKGADENNLVEYNREDVNKKTTRNQIKKSSFLSASMKHRKPHIQKKRDNEAATTEDIPEPYKNSSNVLDKKSKSANEMSQLKKPGFLQRIRQRLSSKNGSSRQEKRKEFAEDHCVDNPVTTSQLLYKELGMDHTVKNLTQQPERTKSQALQRRQYESTPAESKVETLHYQRSTEETDAISQGRCSSFDYFSATASPTDQTLLSADRDLCDIVHRESSTKTPSLRIQETHKKPREEEEKRFATAAEARAYLRKQLASENGGAKVHFEGETEEEEAAFDADDEISNRLPTSSTINDSIYQLQRPHSSMSTSGTGPHHQRESIYFTVVPITNHSSTPSTSPPEMSDLSPLIGDAYVHENNVAKNKDQQQKHPSSAFIQRSKSQQLFTNNKLKPSTSGLLHGDTTNHNNDSTPMIQGSEPSSVKVSRRQLRFVIPQVSICSAEERSSTADLLEIDGQHLNNTIDSKITNQQTSLAFLPETTTSATATILPQMTFGGIGVAPEAEEELKRALSEMDRRELTLAQRRQSNLDVVHQASGRRTSTTLIPLTPAQIHLIRSLWRQVYLSKGPTVIGSQISHRLFFKEPQIREQFRRCPLPHKYVNHDSFSKAHCRHISELVDQIVESLDDLENVGAMLERIGRAHARISGGQLSSKLWNSVAETFIDCTLEWGDRRARSETVRKAWALIIAFMIERIKFGHLEERRQITAIRSTIASLGFAVGSEGSGSSTTVSASATPLSTPIAPQRKQSTSGNEINNDSHLPVPICPIRRVSASTTMNSGAKATPPSTSASMRHQHYLANNYRNNSNSSIGTAVANTLASIASPVTSRRKVATTAAPLPRSSKAQQSPIRTRTMTTARSGGRSSSDVQERAERRAEKVAKHTNV